MTKNEANQKNPSIIATKRFSDTPKEDRPTNIYVEKIDGKKTLWWNTEQGNYEGIQEQTRYNELTKMKIVEGFDYTIEATKAELEKVHESETPKTRYYIKDGNSRIGVSYEELVKSL